MPTTPKSSRSGATSARSRGSKTIETTPKPKPLTLAGVTVRYDPGGPAAIHSLDLSVGPGERLAIIGPSGAGKSTIMAVANGMIVPSSGRSRTFGIDTVDLGRRRNRCVRAEVGTVHQDFALVGSLRVIHNVAAGRLGMRSTWHVARSLLRPSSNASIVEVLDRLGIAEKLWDRTDSLSGGQQQRVAIARVLFQNPELVLADEPVSNLDPARSRGVLDVLMAACDANPSTALVASIHHSPLALEYFSRIIGLRSGRIVFDQTPDRVSDEMLTSLYSYDRPDQARGQNDS